MLTSLFTKTNRYSFHTTAVVSSTHLWISCCSPCKKTLRYSSQGGVGTPTCSTCGFWSQTWRYWFSFLPLHIRLWTTPARAKVHHLMESTEPHYPEATKEENLHQLLQLNILPITVMNRITDKGHSWQSPTHTGKKSDVLPACSCNNFTVTKWLVATC